MLLLEVCINIKLGQSCVQIHQTQI